VCANVCWCADWFYHCLGYQFWLGCNHSLHIPDERLRRPFPDQPIPHPHDWWFWLRALRISLRTLRALAENHSSRIRFLRFLKIQRFLEAAFQKNVKNVIQNSKFRLCWLFTIWNLNQSINQFICSTNSTIGHNKTSIQMQSWNRND